MNIPPLRSSVLAACVACTAAAGFSGPLGAQTAAPALPAPTLARALALVGEAAAALGPPGARVLVLPGTLNGRLQLAPCARVEPHLLAGTPAWGRTRVGLRCVDGPVAWNVSLPVTVQVWAPAVVATVALPAGAQLAEDQLADADTDWAAAAQPPLNKAASLAGRTLVRALAAGQPVRAADLQARLWVAAGDTVRVVTAGGGFAVSGEGQAQAQGLEGQAVRVKMANDKVLMGRVIGQRLVEVAL